MAVTPSAVTSWAIRGALRTRQPPRCPRVIASSAVKARSRTVVPSRCHGSVRAKMAAASLPLVSIWWAMVVAPSGSDGDRLIAGRLGVGGWGGEQEALDLAGLVAPLRQCAQDAGIPGVRVAPRVLAGARLPRGDDGRERCHRRSLRCGLLVGEVLGRLTAAAVHRRGFESEEFAQRRVGGVHRLGERELASDDGLTDQGLGPLRRGLAGEELAQPVAADDLGANPGLIVRDDEAALLACCLGRSLVGILAGVCLARAG